jgi:large subunit ribosomal protein L25
MTEVTIVADTGRATGTRPAKRLRAEEKIPGVVYGQGIDPVSVAIDRRELRHALSGPAGLNAVINLTVDAATHPTVVKAIQRHPVRRSVTHVDFLVVNLNEEITVDVPVVLVGEAKAVLSDGGLVEQTLMALAVSTTPRNIPNEFTIDVSELTIGDSVRVADLELPDGVSSALDPDTLIVTAVATRAAVAEAGEEGEEGEGEAAEGDEGAGAAAEGSDSAE